jgi:tumor protein p53-inducible protein 3
MKAILIDEQRKTLVSGEAEEPALSEDGLRVRVHATALNRADLLQRRGLYPPPAGESTIIGLEMAGVVEKAGSAVQGWQEGDRVFALLPGGGYAEKVSLPAGMAMRIPDSLSFEEAAAIPEAYLTAYLNLFLLGGLKAGQKVLIHAGASGVGTAAIQLIRQAGAEAIITAGSEEKRRFCLQLGASAALDYKTGRFAEDVREWTGGTGVNLVLDSVGAPYWEQNIESLSIDGRMIILGTMGGSQAAGVDLGMLLRRRIQIIGSALRSKAVEDKIDLTRRFADFALPLLEDGRLKPVIDSVWDWEKADEAHEYMEQNRNTGKIVLRVR